MSTLVSSAETPHEASSAPQPRKATRPWRTALWTESLSLIFPGLGQIHARSRALGATLLGIAVALSTALHCITWLRPAPVADAYFVALAMASVLLDVACRSDRHRGEVVRALGNCVASRRVRIEVWNTGGAARTFRIHYGCATSGSASE
jgi:hypothetical protein